MAPALAKRLLFCGAMWCARVQADRGCKHPFPCEVSLAEVGSKANQRLLLSLVFFL